VLLVTTVVEDVVTMLADVTTVVVDETVVADVAIVASGEFDDLVTPSVTGADEVLATFCSVIRRSVTVRCAKREARGTNEVGHLVCITNDFSTKFRFNIG